MKLKPVTLSDVELLGSFVTHQRYESCAYTLCSILAWHNEDYAPYACVNGETLFVFSEFHIQRQYRHLILPISRTQTFSPGALQDIALALERDSYWFVPEHYIHQYGRQEVVAYFEISEHAGYADYIYLTEDLAQLKGNRYAKKRNLINQFERRYLDPGRVQTAPVTPETAAECTRFVEKWCDAYPCDVKSDIDLACEKNAMISAIEHVDRLRLASLLIRIDGEVSAVGIGTGLTAQMGVLHFEKAFTHIKGLYQYLDRQCARELFRGYRYLNKEGDMGLPGLKQAKKSYHPVRMVRSYQLTLR